MNFTISTSDTFFIQAEKQFEHTQFRPVSRIRFKRARYARAFAGAFSLPPQIPLTSSAALRKLSRARVRRAAPRPRAAYEHTHTVTRHAGGSFLTRQRTALGKKLGVLATRRPTHQAAIGRAGSARQRARQSTAEESHQRYRAQSLIHDIATSPAHEAHNNPRRAVSQAACHHGVVISPSRGRNHPLTILSINETLSAP